MKQTIIILLLLRVLFFDINVSDCFNSKLDTTHENITLDLCHSKFI